jgi:hypothetical protein
MIDPRLICAEIRASELLAALENAVQGKPRWRSNAHSLLHDIAACQLPPRSIEALREADARKRAAECMDDICRSDASVY